MRARTAAFIILLSVLAIITTGAGAPENASPLERLAWLEGRWERTSPSMVVQEEWLPAMGNTMMCIGRTVKGDSLVDYELVIIRQHGARFAYEAHPAGQETAIFLSTTLSESGVVFENLQHDFPQRVGYQKIGDDSLLAWIEGPRNGQTQRIEFPYHRVAATR
jgi:Domain of unknown function (DUF6265)